MRAQRRGLVVTTSSNGITGPTFVSAFSAAKFGVLGYTESLAPDEAPFGMRTMLMDPGFFRPELCPAMIRRCGPFATSRRVAFDSKRRFEDSLRCVYIL